MQSLCLLRCSVIPLKPSTTKFCSSVGKCRTDYKLCQMTVQYRGKSLTSLTYFINNTVVDSFSGAYSNLIYLRLTSFCSTSNVCLEKAGARI